MFRVRDLGLRGNVCRGAIPALLPKLLPDA